MGSPWSIGAVTGGGAKVVMVADGVTKPRTGNVLLFLEGVFEFGAEMGWVKFG